ncbi:hypothetical protein GEMRC1_009482 [Eukaryota sp. GEM-RC1]
MTNTVQLLIPIPTDCPRKSAFEKNVKRSKQLVKAGELSKAFSTLTRPVVSFSLTNEQVLQKLQDLHPQSMLPLPIRAKRVRFSTPETIAALSMISKSAVDP